MAKVLIVLSLLSMSFGSFSKDLGYDPFNIEITEATAVKEGELRYNNSVVLNFNRLQNSVINLKLESAKESNKKLLIESSLLDGNKRQRATLTLSENAPDDEWKTFDFQDINLENSTFFSQSFFSYKCGNKVKNICIFQKEIEDHLQYVIKIAKLRKLKICINISALRSKNKQKYLRGQQIARIVGSNYSL